MFWKVIWNFNWFFSVIDLIVKKNIFFFVYGWLEHLSKPKFLDLLNIFRSIRNKSRQFWEISLENPARGNTKSDIGFHQIWGKNGIIKCNIVFFSGIYFCYLSLFLAKYKSILFFIQSIMSHFLFLLFIEKKNRLFILCKSSM